MDTTTISPTKDFEPLNIPNQFENISLGMLLNEINISHLANTITNGLMGHGDINITELMDNITMSLDNSDNSVPNNRHIHRDPMTIVIPVTICYAIIFVAGILGNVITCAVISRNKSMHTATNYYLFNLAISDLLLLLSGLPQDTYSIWWPYSYPLNQSFCILQGLLSETSTNATVLTITSFTIERYIAICHPFRQHTMSKLSRAIKFIMAVWVVAFCLAIPQAIQFGLVPMYGGRLCTVKNVLVEHAFEISSFLFFFGPMTLICVLYVLIGVKLRKSKMLQGVKRRGCEFGRGISGQTRVIRMLIAVAVAFFFCWAPFHAQRIMAVYGKATKTQNVIFRDVYTMLTYISGVLYFLSTCINPLLYSIMSHKFRDAFKVTIARHCGLGGDYVGRNHTYSALSRCNGNGSFKLTATPNQLHRAHTLNNGPRLDINRANAAGAATPPSGTSPIPITPEVAASNVTGSPIAITPMAAGTNPKFPNAKNDDKYHQKFLSPNSQSTLLTLSRADGNGAVTSKTGNNLDNRGKKSTALRNISKPDVTLPLPSANVLAMANDKVATNPATTTLGTIAEKLRRGTKRVLLFKQSTNASQTTNGIQQQQQPSKDKEMRILEKGNSVESNTISNSSLQEVDEDEFESAELAKYMGQVNSEIR